MTDTVAAIAAALRADAEALRVISQNIANAQTPAYRREIALSRVSYADAVAGTIEPPALETALDFNTGALESTGEPLDLAIEGKGFFVLATEQGEVLTRRGDFRLDAAGTIVARTGQPLLGANGPIRVGDQQPFVTADGTVRVGDTVVDRLRVVEVALQSALTPVGDGTYLLTNPEHAVESSASQVRQGFVEGSNVQSVNETVQLMETMRSFEMAQRFMRSYDDMMDDTITTLGKI